MAHTSGEDEDGQPGLVDLNDPANILMRGMELLLCDLIICLVCCIYNGLCKLPSCIHYLDRLIL